MTHKKGFIILPRSIQDGPFYTGEMFCKQMAFIDLVMMAAYKKSHYRNKGVLIEVNIGQVSISQETLASKWLWSRGKVIRFLNELETVQEIVQDKTGITTLITILNYKQYTAGGTARSTGNSTGDGTIGGTHTKEYKRNKEGGSAFLQAPPLRRIKP